MGHKGGRTFGYRVEEGACSVVYLPDHAPALGRSDGSLDVIRGADVLIHDAQFLAAERAMADAYGHATVDDAVDLAVAARVGTLVLFHHGTSRTDEQLDAIVASLVSPPELQVVAAREGDTLQVPFPP